MVTDSGLAILYMFISSASTERASKIEKKYHYYMDGCEISEFLSNLNLIFPIWNNHWKSI
jgi:hypothetical protein